jgi:hypothetical protein
MTSNETSGTGQQTKSPVETSHAFRDLVSDIKRVYEDLRHRLGWRFLCVSRSVLDTPVDVAFISLNPNGDSIPAGRVAESCENGVAYVAEEWGVAPRGQHKLQVQVQKLFEGLNRRLRIADSGSALMQRSLMGYFIPFGSRRLADLAKPVESYEFGCDLWRRVLALTTPRLIVCIDRETYIALQSIIPCYTGMSVTASRSFRTGWGRCTADLLTYGGEQSVRLLRLPHLSSFQLFSSSYCTEHLAIILDKTCNNLKIKSATQAKP